VSDARRILRKIAAEAYDVVAESGEEFELDFVQSLVASDEAARSLGQQLLEVAVEAAVRSVDESRRSRPEQGDLFSDLDRVLAIGDGRRKRKGACLARDYVAHMQIVAVNAALVASAAAREQEEYARLLPHLAAGLTVAEAVEVIKGEAS
jgi:hypothetical protein